MKGRVNMFFEVNLMIICYHLKRHMSILLRIRYNVGMEALKSCVLSKIDPVLSLLLTFISKRMIRYPLAFTIFKSPKRYMILCRTCG